MDKQLHEDIGAMKESVDALKSDIVALQQEVATLSAQANRWKGAFVVLLGVGGAFGWALDRVITAFQSS